MKFFRRVYKMRKNFFKKISAVALSLTMVVGMVGTVPAAVKTGTDISNGVKWQAFSIHTREDGGKWEDELKKDGQVYNNKKDAFKSYGENAKLAAASTNGDALLNITSTGYSAQWTPMGTVVQSNPWGVTLKKILNIDRGRTYTISFKIKSTLKNEIKQTKKRKDGTGYNVGTGKMNYIKHVHLKAYRNNTKDGDPSEKLYAVKATYKGANVLSNTKDFKNMIKLDSRNDDYVTVTAKVTVPGDTIKYKQKTMGFMFAMGAFLKEFPNENDMSGQVEIKDFKVVAGNPVATSKAPKLKTKKAKKAYIKATASKVKGAKSYEFQYSAKKNFSSKTKVASKKNTVKLTGKKIKSKKKIYVRTRVKTRAGYTVWSKAKSIKVK